MKALTWHGKHDVRCETVDDPEILNPRDAIIRVTSTAICGSDLHLYDGYIPSMMKGDVLGHEPMGEVVEVGRDSSLKVGQRVVIPFTITAAAATIARSNNMRAARMATRPTSRTWGARLMASRWSPRLATAI